MPAMAEFFDQMLKKAKAVPLHTLKANSGTTGTAPLILYLVQMPKPLYP